MQIDSSFNSAIYKRADFRPDRLTPYMHKHGKTPNILAVKLNPDIEMASSPKKTYR